MRGSSRQRTTVVGLMAMALAVPAVLVAPAVTAQESYATSAQLQQDVRLNRVLRHLDRFQRFAEQNEGNRAAGTPGYDASARYVYAELQKAGYNVTFQDFPFRAYRPLGPTVFEQISPTPTVYAETVDYNTATYSGAGDVTGVVQEVDVVEPPGPNPSDSSSGCEPEDFATFTPGNIALVQRGTCDFGLKAQNADEAGAIGVIIYNEGTPGFPDRNNTLNPTLGQYDVTVPVVGVSYALGRALVGTTVRIAVDSEIIDTTTRNVIAETPDGDASNVVMSGAHLDSVFEGPGINDNGSGSAALLEVALQAAKYQHRQKLRFAWWGAEEANLVGSNYYVANLTEEELANIALYLNYDMVGSPNFVRFVYDGDGSAFGLVGPPGSAQIEQTYADFYAANALDSDPTAFSGRSDYQAFILNGVPAGGLFTGAEGLKTEDEAARYGGTAGEQYDPCYHEACDTRGNISTVVLDQNSNAIAHITATYAYSIQTILDAKAAAAGDAGGAARTAEAVTAADLAAAA